MIRINLLATERRGAKAAAKGFEAGQKITVIGSLILVIAAAGIGWRYWALGQQEASIARGIDAAQREEQRLATILKEVAGVRGAQDPARSPGRVDRRAAQRAERPRAHGRPDQPGAAGNDVADQPAAERLRAHDSGPVPDADVAVGLSSATSKRRATSRRPVEIVDSAVIPGDDKSPDLIGFTIRGMFQMAGVDAPEPTGRRAPARKR